MVLGDQVCCIKTSPIWVDFWLELLCPLLTGVHSIVCPPAALLSPALLLSALQQVQPTRLHLVPSLLRALLMTGVAMPSLLLLLPCSLPLPPAPGLLPCCLAASPLSLPLDHRAAYLHCMPHPLEDH